jgi:hypothetical protein
MFSFKFKTAAVYIYFLSVFTSKTTSSETFDVNDGTTLSSIKDLCYTN